MTLSPFHRLTAWGVLIALPALHAATGVIPIDQNAAIAGSVTPDDEPGFPVTLSQSGSYRLESNLIVEANTTAILITADAVTLDLNGFSIIGPVVCTGSPAVCPSMVTGAGILSGSSRPGGLKAVRVLNGTVMGMGNIGVLIGGRASVVERVTAIGNAGGGIVAERVVASTATLNGSFGILATNVRGCTSTENGADGIILADTGGVVTESTASLNGGLGVAAPYGTVAGNSMFLNKSFGISARCPASIVGNTLLSVGGNDVQVDGSGCVLANNATRQ